MPNPENQHHRQAAQTPAEKMLPNVHIVSAPESTEFHPLAEAAYLNLLNAEQAALQEGAAPSVLPLYGQALKHAKAARERTSDELSGLLNREGINLWFERNKPEKFAVLFLDARNFKKINDTYGHNTGDDVITYMGQRLTSRLRFAKAPERYVEKRKNPQAKDAVAGIGRWGGDEMLVVVDLKGVDDKDDSKVVNVIQDKLSDFGTYTGTNNEVSIPISIRSAAMIGRASDNKPLSDYQAALDAELIQLKEYEK